MNRGQEKQRWLLWRCQTYYECVYVTICFRGCVSTCVNSCVQVGFFFCAPGIACMHVCTSVCLCLSLSSALHRLQPNKHWIALFMRSVRRRNKHTQTAGPTCPNKRVADWQNILSTPPQIRLHSFKAPDFAWHCLFVWLVSLPQQLLLQTSLMVKGVIHSQPYSHLHTHLWA